MTPRVSTIIAVRDGAAYLGETLVSIATQTRPVDEIIVVDDGSTDESASIAAAFGPTVTVISTPATGAAAARNVGIDVATGEILALCDADDLWLPDKIRLQLALVDDPAEPVAMFCGVEEFASPELAATDLPGRAPHPDLRNVRLASALLMTRPAFDATGPFHESSGIGDWMEWAVRMTSAVPTTVHHPDILVRRRLHQSNNSLRTADRSSAWASTLAAHVKRRREQPE